MRYVFVRPSYINDLKAGLPLSYLEFWFAKQDEIDQKALDAFQDPRPSTVDAEHDIAELRGHWEEGRCDFFVDAWLRSDDTIALVSISFDFDPLYIR